MPLLADAVNAHSIILAGALMAGNATIQGTARQPEAQGRLTVIMFLIVGLVEAMYFINLVLGFFFIVSYGNSVK